jgi:hypothetical protein
MVTKEQRREIAHRWKKEKVHSVMYKLNYEGDACLLFDFSYKRKIAVRDLAKAVTIFHGTGVRSFRIGIVGWLK